MLYRHLILTVLLSCAPLKIQENIPSENDLNKKTSVAGIQSFKELYEQLPGKLSKTMAKNLSIPIVFVCLLHLANEKVSS